LVGPAHKLSSSATICHIVRVCRTQVRQYYLGN
jgi:hypothetical protein